MAPLQRSLSMNTISSTTRSSTSLTKALSVPYTRRRVTPEQLKALNKLFDVKSHPSREDRATLANEMSMCVTITCFASGCETELAAISGSSRLLPTGSKINDKHRRKGRPCGRKTLFVQVTVVFNPVAQHLLRPRALADFIRPSRSIASPDSTKNLQGLPSPSLLANRLSPPITQINEPTHPAIKTTCGNTCPLLQLLLHHPPAPKVSASLSFRSHLKRGSLWNGHVLRQELRSRERMSIYLISQRWKTAMRWKRMMKQNRRWRKLSRLTAAPTFHPDSISHINANNMSCCPEARRTSTRTSARRQTWKPPWSC